MCRAAVPGWGERLAIRRRPSVAGVVAGSHAVWMWLGVEDARPSGAMEGETPSPRRERRLGERRRWDAARLDSSPEAEAEIARQLAEDPDTYEWTGEVWARAMTTEELSREFAQWAEERQAALETGRLERVTITLDRETINWFKAQTGEDGETGGTKWMMLVEKTLQECAQREMQP